MGGQATPWSVEGSSRIRGEVTDTVTLILGSSQEEMTMLALVSDETSYLSSVTIWDVQIQQKVELLQLKGRCKHQGHGWVTGSMQGMWNLHGPETQTLPSRDIKMHMDNGPCV